MGDNILAIEKYPVLEENIKQIYERVHFDKEHNVSIFNISGTIGENLGVYLQNVETCIGHLRCPEIEHNFDAIKKYHDLFLAFDEENKLSNIQE